jgi:hypothetical protein
MQEMNLTFPDSVSWLTCSPAGSVLQQHTTKPLTLELMTYRPAGSPIALGRKYPIHAL